jgi:cell division protein FtsL
MINRGLLFWTAVAVATGIGLFLVKYRVAQLEDRLEAVNREILDTQRTTQILKVEWAHLNEIARIERLNDKYLHLQPIVAKQITAIDAVPPRREAPTASTRNGADAPSSTSVGGRAAPAEAGSPTPASAPSSAPNVVRTAGPPTPPNQPAVQEPVTVGPAEDVEEKYDSIDELLSGRAGGQR